MAIHVGAKSEPDFLALTGTGLVHVLESKGRAGFGTYGVTERVINGARNKALRQVCQIATVNGAPPETRMACVFAFDQSGTFGQVTDPPSSETYDYQTDVQRLIRQSYAVVLDPLFQHSALGSTSTTSASSLSQAGSSAFTRPSISSC